MALESTQDVCVVTLQCFVALFVSAVVSGCLPTMQSGGFTVHKSSTEEAFTQVKSRAEFELKCLKDQIELVVLGVRSDLYKNNYPNQIGATGCGHKAVYVESRSGGWVMNTETGA